MSELALANENTLTRSHSATGTFSLLTVAADWDEPRLRARWAELSDASDDVNALYSSPLWFDLLREKHSDDNLALGVAYGPAGEIAGVVPVVFNNYPFQFFVSSRPVLTLELKAAHLLGSVPMMPDDAGAHARFLASIFERRVDCVYMDTVPVESYCWKFLREEGRKRFLVHTASGPRPWRLMQLPPTLEEYLSGLGSKKRCKLRRDAKILSEHNGPLEMIRAESPEQVEEFLTDAVRVSRNSWQHTNLGQRLNDSDEDHAWVERLARKGVLRSYLLKSGGRPCTFVIGHQHRGIFHSVEIGYDRDFAEFSSGTVLLNMLIQDLCSHRPARLLNFGVGDGDYKRRFGNVQMEDVSVLVLRKNLLNRCRVVGHATFRALVRAARSVVKRGK